MVSFLSHKTIQSVQRNAFAERFRTHCSNGRCAVLRHRSPKPENYFRSGDVGFRIHARGSPHAIQLFSTLINFQTFLRFIWAHLRRIEDRNKGRKVKELVTISRKETFFSQVAVDAILEHTKRFNHRHCLIFHLT